MKKLVVFVVFMACIVPSAYPQDALAQWDKANTLYINGDYVGAAETYETIVSGGYVSGRLFYNLGNAYFKAGNLGRSILNYNRARLLSPYDRDTEYNLAVANGYVKDRIDTVPEFFLVKWLKTWRSLLDSNGWAVVSLVWLSLALAGALLFLLAGRRGWRKAGFFSGLAFLILFVWAAVFAGIGKKEFSNASQAVVMVQSVSVKSSPEKTGSDIFILHEGTKADVVSSYGGWTEIMIADGNKGWLPDDAIELITY